MTNAWRAAGLTYIQYSNICARVVRQALKSNLRADAAKRNETHVKFTPWSDGKPAHEK
ncbi:protein stunted isoform X2 [Anastrepha ludens]|uniref:protein stunted isoform X2 n=1 Tax=Anastrepha ludens TaxID=28586 RepID=UPI0023B13A50|nr:protein stunted isoform X2 [Anastrepha ludens]